MLISLDEPRVTVKVLIVVTTAACLSYLTMSKEEKGGVISNETICVLCPEGCLDAQENARK